EVPMRQFCPLLSLALWLSALPLTAQRVSPDEMHVRIYAVVPAAPGTANTAADPARPKYFPRPGSTDRPAIRFKGFSGIRSPDGTRWFVLIVCDNRRDLSALLEDPAVVWVDREITPRAQVELLLRGVSPLASLDRLRVRVP
ncbi:MAG: hypothetical protein ACRDH2_17475, partial [Anaerolineales bacterium]